MKLPADVGVDKGPPIDIGRLQPGRSREFSKKCSATFGRFAIGIGEIKRAVLRESENCFHKRPRSREKATRWQIDRNGTNLHDKRGFPNS